MIRSLGLEHVAEPPVVHAVDAAVLEDGDVAARVPLPGRVEAQGDVLRLRVVQPQLSRAQPLDEVVVHEQLQLGTYVDAVIGHVRLLHIGPRNGASPVVLLPLPPFEWGRLS